jgi:hypothetical protein
VDREYTVSNQRDLSAVPSADLAFYDETDELWRVPLTRWDGRGFGDNGAEIFNYVSVGTTTDGDVYLEDGAGGNDTILTVAEAQLLIVALRGAIDRAAEAQSARTRW